jgi:hypothetical protein
MKENGCQQLKNNACTGTSRHFVNNSTNIGHDNTMTTTKAIISYSLVYCTFLIVIKSISQTQGLNCESPTSIVRYENSESNNHHWYGQRLFSASISNNDSNMSDNKAMAFLKKIGKVGSSDGQRDIRFAVGVDEGQAGKTMQNGMKVSAIIIIYIIWAG